MLFLVPFFGITYDIVILTKFYKNMNKLIILIFLAISSLSFSQNVFKEDYNSNDNHWDIKSTATDKYSLSDGFVNWSRTGAKSKTLTRYMNRLDDTKDFDIIIHVLSKKMGSEYGVMWGGMNKSNASYFTIKGGKFRTFRAKGGKIVASTEYRMNLKIKSDNIITVQKRGGQVNFLVNGSKVHSEVVNRLEGKFYGMILFQNSSIAVDYIYIKGMALPINEIKDLYYPEKPVKLSSAINSQYNEMNPIISADGKKLYFSRRSHPENIKGIADLEDAYSSDNFKGVWSKAKNLGYPINNGGPNAVHAVTPDGNTLILMNTYEPDGRMMKGRGLSVANKTTKGWEIPKEFKIRNYYNKSDFNEYFMSNDGLVVILSIERDGTEGDRDLYVSFNEGNGIWSTPKNMGRILNTPGTELSPFLASDGVTLYFSSNGHPGYGKNDVFMCRRLDASWTNWTKPLNIGKPINTKGVDSYYSIPASADYAYYVSSDSQLKTTDIYKVKLPEKVKPKPVVLVRGVVRDSKTDRPIGAKITYHDYKTDKEIGIANSDPVTGKYEIVLPLNKVYSFFADKKGYYAIRERLDLMNVSTYKEIVRDLYLTPFEVGQSAQMHNVLFKRGTPILLPGSYAELNNLVKVLKTNATMVIKVSGHTDNTGSKDLNLKLSKERATSVMSYLVKKGVEQSRVSAEGFGGSKPIADNAKEETRKLNRRVEFEIISD